MFIPSKFSQGYGESDFDKMLAEYKQDYDKEEDEEEEEEEDDDKEQKWEEIGAASSAAAPGIIGFFSSLGKKKGKKGKGKKGKGKKGGAVDAYEEPESSSALPIVLGLVGLVVVGGGVAWYVMQSDDTGAEE